MGGTISNSDWEREDAARKSAELSRLKHIEELAKRFLNDSNKVNKEALREAIYPKISKEQLNYFFELERGEMAME